MNQKSLFLAVTLATLLVISGAFWLMQKRQVAMNQPVTIDPVVESPVKTEPQTPIDTSDWKTYQNEEYGFEFIMPAEWSIEKTNTLAVFYLKSEYFEPVLLGYTAKNEPFYSQGEIKVEIFNNPSNLSIQKRYLQFDDIYRTYIDNTNRPYSEEKVMGRELLVFESHRDFNLNTGNYQTLRILKIKNKILHFDYISEGRPDSKILATIQEVVRSVSD